MDKETILLYQPANRMEDSSWNLTDVHLDDIKMDSNFAWMLFSLISGMVWVIYITYYNSRVTAYIVTRLLTRFYATKGYLSIGSFTVCALSGKIMFRDIIYITEDYTIRVQDGWLIFRWWRSYVPKDVSEDLSHSDTRLSVMLNGFELHVYNRCKMYSNLEKVFNLDPSIIPWDELSVKEEEAKNNKDKKQEAVLGKSWRDLIPVIKMEVSSGRVVFGNRLIPTTLLVNVEEAHFVYSTKPAASKLDHFMHFVKCKAENFKVILAPSPKYTGMADDPPRYMGAGFVVFSSNNIELYYYMDEPGVVPEEPEMLQLANGDIVESAPPIWGIDIKCGKGTDFSYGPWADRQREHLFKLFFPQDYQALKVSDPPLPGEKRQVQAFDIRLNTLYESTIDILFSKNKETNAIHINVGPGSYMEITLPWLVAHDGYTTKITGQLLHLEATTSLQFRSLLESETLEFTAHCHYPIQWNDHQEWLFNLTGCKATGWFTYAHKGFFQEMINDWASKSRPDILHFVPYTWKFSVLMKEFELITISNEYNWIDCSSQNQENALIAASGDLFDFSFDLPFTEFLPDTLPLRFWIQGESIDLSMYLPEVYTSRSVLLSLNQNAKLLGRDGKVYKSKLDDNGRKWRNVCQKSLGWVDCWTMPIVALSINFIYHPMPMYGPPPQADITTPEKEEKLLSPMRMQHHKTQNVPIHWTLDEGKKFDPTTLPADKVSLELEIGSSIMFLYGSWLRHFFHLKESIFGEDQIFTDMNDKLNPKSTNTDKVIDQDSSSLSDIKIQVDPREYRPIEVVISITMHDLQAHLIKNCNDNDPPCPVIIIERFGLEMKKSYRDTQLQLLLSPSLLISSDKLGNRPAKDHHLNQGHLMLSALQIRGHAMFSDAERNLNQDTLEYAWLLEIQLGKLSGKATAPQLFHVVTGLETMFLLMFDSENQLKPAHLPLECHHGSPPSTCPHNDPQACYRCPTADEIKYRMTRVAIDAIDIYLVESGTAINLWASPLRLSHCNLHSNHLKSGITLVIPAVKLKQFICAGAQNTLGLNSNTNTTGSNRSQQRNISGISNENQEMWLEIGSASLGPFILELASSLSDSDKNLHLVQHKYLKLHDDRYKRLWFLWPSDRSLVTGKCGCVGGCAFFGRNRNGQRFFKPSRNDIQDGINIAALRVNESGKDPGFGQSILHDCQLIFHTPPYNIGSGVVIHDHPVPQWPNIRLVNKVYQDQSEGSKNSSNAPTNMPYTIDSEDIPSPLPTHPLSRRFSYSSAASRLNGVQTISREVPYSRLIDASPTPVLKMDSRPPSPHRFNTTRSILSVPENTLAVDNGACPKYSVSDSRLAVDYFNTTALQYNALVTSAQNNSISAANADSIHSLHQTSSKHPYSRTLSITSDNPSEVFFSAEEDLTLASNLKSNERITLGSARCSSLKSSLNNSGIGQNESFIKNHFGSETTIIPSSPAILSNTTVSDDTAIEHQDHTILNIDTLECDLADDEKTLLAVDMSRDINQSPLLKPKHNLIDNEHDGGIIDSSDSRSISSTSFMSAVSSQEDLALINLHMHINKPIVDSPLLLTTYTNHLSQISCGNWSQTSLPAGSDAFTVPIYQHTIDDRLVFIGSRYLPKFETTAEGFTSLKMVPRTDAKEKEPSPLNTQTQSSKKYTWDQSQFDFTQNAKETFEIDCEEEMVSLRSETGTRTTVVIKLKGDIDLMITPLALESLQKFVDSLIPTFSNLHPLTVLNHLHSSCISRVEAANILKRDKYLSQMQGGGSKRSTVERVKPNLNKDAQPDLQQPNRVYEEFIASQVQGTVILPKINICVLQASIVEEVISFSALDNIRDLTCVSLLAICLEELTTKFHFSKQAREIVQTYHPPAVAPSGQKKGVLSRAAGKAFLLGLNITSEVDPESTHGEPVYIETSEKQQEETVITLHINRAHAQLRRLHNECSILKEAVITAIPGHCSKVMFKTCSKGKSTEIQNSVNSDNDEMVLTNISDEKMGFIMMECGFEGIAFKVVKRSNFEKENDREIRDLPSPSPVPESTVGKVSHSEIRPKNEDNIDSKANTSSKQDVGGGSTPMATPKQIKTPSETFINNEDTADNTVAKVGIDKNASSCVMEVCQVWFNFAAPPLTPITRKIDYTRHDWNLLSTASPAINAWMNPSNRFAMRLVQMLRTRYRRCTAVVTCLMAEALDVQSLHIPLKSRYRHTTPLAKTLQEDPSCQLCNILQKYLLQSDVAIDTNLKDPFLPNLSILRQGVIVLSRQWKNILYTPLLLEHNFKSRHHNLKPLNVTFAVSDAEEDGEASGEEGGEGITDECAMLLTSERHSHVSTLQRVLKSHTNKCGPKGNYGNESHYYDPFSPTGVIDQQNDSVAISSHNSSCDQPKNNKSLLPTQMPASSRASVMFPILDDTVQHTYKNIVEVPLGDNNYQAPVEGENLAGSVEAINMSPQKSDRNEDLYTWMAKQDFINPEPRVSNRLIKAKKIRNWRLRKGPLRTSESKNVPLTSDNQSSADFAESDSLRFNIFPKYDSLRLLDAHLIFEPLLSSLGVMPQQMVNPNNSSNNGMAALDSWGSNLSLVGSLETMRIDIVVSEYGKVPETGKKSKSFKNKSKSETPWLDLLPEVPAFLCDRVSIECDVRRSADMTVVDDIRRQRRNMLYLSRGQLKKHSNTSFNICVSVRYISQQVNMPLLRLLNQITNMYQNVKDTQTELREQQPHPYVSRTNAKPPASQSDQSEVPVPTPPPIKRFLPRSASELKPIVSPSPSIRSKHQTLAQKLRSTGKSVKGYMNLSETPVVSECLTPSLSEFERITPMKPIDEVDSNIVSMTPRCWKTVYHLLELYATMPETKTVTQRISFGVDVSEGYKGTRKYDILSEAKSCDDIDKDGSTSTPVPPVSQLNQRITKEERTRLMVFVVVRIHRTRLLATLSGLKLEAEITNLHTSSTFRKKTRPPSLECSLTGHIGRTMIVLLEGVAPNQQTVVKVTVGKSQTLYSSMSRRTKDQNSGLLTIGVVNIDIPQHPVALHGMMTRGSKQLSSTLQELRVARTSSRMGRVPTIDESDAQGSIGLPSMTAQQSPMVQRVHKEEVNKVPIPEPNALLQPLVMHFTAVIQCLTVTAALLPSLRAQYKMDQVTSTGYTGNKAKFIIDLPQHTLSFSTKIPVTETNLPSEASIELPKVHVSAEYILDGGLKTGENQFSGTDGAVLRQGNYLSAVADIGIFEQSLTTDLLNHLVFVQKVFMKEVNEVVQKVYGGEKPVPIWLEDNDTNRSSPVKRILFSLTVKMRRIELTATTPTNCAVRLETGSADFQLSNRVQNVSGSSYQTSEQVKIFVKAHIDVNLSLGQVIRNPLFEEADPEFQSFAFFKTRIELRNAFQGEMVGEGEDKEVILITLRRPLIYIQPLAVDKAILVWLNYKNAYEYWNEQRASLNKEVLTATQPSTEKLPSDKIPVSPNLGTIFLQLTVEDMGICVPLNPLPQTTWGLNRSIFMDFESCSAVVITLESTSISACSSGSLVSKGRFIGLCLRFADDFDSSLDDWKPDITNELVSTAMNLCIVSEGTYEVCSRTTSQKLDSITENAKWFLNVKWQMEGVDMHLDVNIGKQLSALGHTLTALTGVQDTDDPLSDSDPISQDSDIIRHKSNMEGDILASLAIDPTMSAKTRSKIIEKEMYEQAKAINDLRSLGASQGTIEHEVKRLRELEAMVFKGFRRDMIQKLRRQSVKGKSSLKGKFGLSNKSSTYRSKSFIVSPTQEVSEFKETQSPDEVTSLSSVENSPQAGPQRSTSFRVTHPGHVTFSNTKEIFRQSSLPSASSEQSLTTEGDDSWPNTDYDRHMDSRDDFLVNPLFVSGTTQKPQEPNIDFELDVKVFINSGKCVLHTKDSVKEDEIKLMSRMKKERSCSGGVFEYVPGSPNLPRRSYKDKLGANSTSSSRLRHHQTVTNTLSQLSELTIFHIPGLDFKVHYASKMVSDEGQSLMYSIDSSGVISRKTSTKKASLYCWATLQSIPEETIISPHILEFLEQTLAPIPAQQFADTGTFDTMFATDNDDDLFAPYLTPGQYAYTSFPVDVIVYLHVQTSTFRFSCLPVSRVECMLKLPSLDIVFSSKRTDSSNELEDYYEDSNSLPVAVGGLSITGVMADFSMYIFHPYGGKKSSANLKEPHTHTWSPLADGERKDSLSVNVEFIKFHLSRSRKLNFESVPGPKTTSDQSHATIRFSTIVDIGSASFKYDMRRLTEILAFPRAWYRRSIVRRLFLGDLTRTVPSSVYSDHSNNVDPEDSYGNFVTDSKLKPSRDKLHLNIKGDKHLPLEKKKNNSSHDSSPDQKSSSVGAAAWETLVIFAVNFKRLNVHMNMGNVMGNVTWLSKQFHSEGRLSIGSTGHKNMHIGLGLGGSGLDAKGGIVGGTIELNKINTYVLIREDPGSEPRHTVGLKLSALELRLDYMGTAVLMSRVSSLEVVLKDEWKVLNKAISTDSIHDSSKRPGIVFMHGDLGWDQLQLMISKSTSSDIMKMFYKLEEFFSQQFKSSKRVFSSLQDHRESISNEKSSKKKTVRRRILISTSSPDNITSDECKHHHRHWQRALEAVSGLRLSTLKYPLPHWGTVLGGKMDLHGVNISLACFHGINFKSKSWALFSLKEPCISFATEAHEVFNFEDSGPLCRDDLDINIVQNLTFSLGMEGTVRPQHSMATVCKFSRNVLFPPQFKTIQEWFNYAFALSEIDEVDRFPSLEREKQDTTESAPRSRTPKPQENLTHTREVIFALPTLQLNLKSYHTQPVKLPSPYDIKPTVECSFITEFEDHIFVTVDAEAFFFLHDLITSYILEKDKVSSMTNRPQSPETSNTGNTSQPTMESPQSFTNDWRDYNCTTWHLEPTVRLLSWGGKSIEPYGVDYILQKLGFSHARTTIPKWMQRGFMDPLDKVLSVLMLRMIAIAREEDVARRDDPV
ncbi:bridge-like lipid transfer protein family member 1 isoform X1 [Rhopalosiphum padi]|uniref:bridge-like lipid transfer protein family member 1 isoform X1 n=1 Tax=Rhopalosiphum padi TaxID=40932 RepID=UPI00298DC92B|nr:bridge-like lipid transfer protein family member 1 isoform X1 [Rhopalosiphum padi]XP_060850803.1 bridge-like lipid transfer protein family member 1 isoform X1 [Rhopalosiphum padi]XP_060850804.1 bridge-like lipid transfer protein family member 1 isoform X1 [Rhopalosiphum padi]